MANVTLVILWQFSPQRWHCIKKIRPVCKEAVDGRHSCLMVLYPPCEQEVRWRTHVHLHKKFQSWHGVHSIECCVDNQYQFKLINYSLGVKLVTIQQCSGKFLVTLGHTLIVGLWHLRCIILFLNHKYLAFGECFKWFFHKMTPRSIKR